MLMLVEWAGKCGETNPLANYREMEPLGHYFCKFYVVIYPVRFGRRGTDPLLSLLI